MEAEDKWVLTSYLCYTALMLNQAVVCFVEVWRSSGYRGNKRKPVLVVCTTFCQGATHRDYILTSLQHQRNL